MPLSSFPGAFSKSTLLQMSARSQCALRVWAKFVCAHFPAAFLFQFCFGGDIVRWVRYGDKVGHVCGV
eukprot:5112159-Lingulodinium_polyedra.AAC.1